MMSDTSTSPLSVTVFLGILLLTILLGYGIRRTGFKWATEGSIALLLGLAAGGAMYLYYWLLDPRHRVPRRLVQFDEDTYFQTLLPPIIFAAGFSIKKQLFFRNFMTLMLFGVGGTIFMAAVLSASSMHLMGAVGLRRHGLLRTSLALGSVLSCTDSVATLQLMDRERAPLLYALLFGEGVVNDATAIVMLGAIAEMPSSTTEDDVLSPEALLRVALQFLRLFVLSTGLGLGMGLTSAALVRWLLRRPSCHVASGGGGGHAGAGGGHGGGPCSPDREVLVVALLGLGAYFLAEALDLSAILSVFFCGVCMSHYTWHGLSPAAKVITRHGFHVISAGCEVVLFVAAGLDVWATAVWWGPDPGDSPNRTLFASLTLAGGLLAALLAARAAFTFPVCWVANLLWRRRDPIPRRGAAVLWWGGLPRGAITLALGYHCFYRDAARQADQLVVLSSVILVVIATTVGLGVVTQPVMHAFMPALQPLQPLQPLRTPQQMQQMQQTQQPQRSRSQRSGRGSGGGGGAAAADDGPAGSAELPLLHHTPTASATDGGADDGSAPTAGTGTTLAAAPLGDGVDAGGGAAGVQVRQHDDDDGDVEAGYGEDPRQPLLVPRAQQVATVRLVNLSPAGAGISVGGGVAAVGSGGSGTAVAAVELHGAESAGVNELLWLGDVLGVHQSRGAESRNTSLTAGGAVLAGEVERAQGATAGERAGAEQTTWVHLQWRRFDERWLQPLFGGSRAEPPGGSWSR